MKKSKIDLKQLNTLVLKELLKKKNWEKIEEVLPAAEQFGVSGRLLQKTWTELGQHQKGSDKLVTAIESFSHARKHSIENEKIFVQITESLSGFVTRFERQFSREDLVRLEFAFERVYTFHKNKSHFPKDVIDRAKSVLDQIRLQKEVAPSKIETPASSNVFRIFAALYPGMTQPEVEAEFARIVAPLVRRRMAELKDKPKKKAKASGGKKPPKDKDSDDDEKGDSNKDDKNKDNKKPKK
ncbi:MAG: hypothetical protein ACYC09_11095 [Bacteroidota bacterium]